VPTPFDTLNEVQQNTSGMLQQLQQLQQLRMAPQQAEMQQQDSLMRSLGDLLPPEAIQYLLQQRLPGLAQGMSQTGPQAPAGISPEMLAQFQQMLAQPQAQ
jgi:hypothetical protein